MPKHKYTHTCIQPNVQLFGVFINLLLAMCFFLFFYLYAAFCCWSLFPSFSLRLLFLHLPPGSCWTSCCGCLQKPIHPPPLPPCLQEFVPHYPSLLHPNQPSHPAWSHSFSTVLSHYLRRHQRGRALRDIRHSHSVRGLGAADRADRWLRQAKGFVCPAKLNAERSLPSLLVHPDAYICHELPSSASC